MKYVFAAGLSSKRWREVMFILLACSWASPVLGTWYPAIEILVLDDPAGGNFIHSEPAGTYMCGILFTAEAGEYTFDGNTVDLGSSVIISHSPATQTIGVAASLNYGSMQMQLDAGTTVVFTNEISGTGGIVQDGLGTLVLNHANTFSGGFKIYNGTVEIGDDAALGTGEVTVAGATLRVSDANISNALRLSGELFVDIGSELTLQGNISLAGHTTIRQENGWLDIQRAVDLAGFDLVLQTAEAYIGGDISGEGRLVVRGSASLSGVNTYTGETLIYGDLEIWSGQAIPETSVVYIESPNTESPNLTIYYPLTIGGLSGDGTVALSSESLTLNVTGVQEFWGNLDTVAPMCALGMPAGEPSFEYDVIKTGEGTQMLRGDCIISGELQILQGTLELSGSVDGDVVNDALFTGTGEVYGNLTIRNGGTHAPGDYSELQMVGGDYTLADGATLEVEVYGNAQQAKNNNISRVDLWATRLYVGGDVTLEDGSTVAVTTLNDQAIHHGDTYTIMSVDGTLTNAGAQIVEDSALLDWSLLAKNGDLMLEASVASDFAQPATPGNNRNLGHALDDMFNGSSTAEQSAMLGELQALNTNSYNKAVTQLTPHQAPAVAETNLQTTHTVNSYLGGHLGQARAGLVRLNPAESSIEGLLASSESNPQVMSYAIANAEEKAGNDNPLERRLDQPLNVFAKTFGVREDQDTTSDQLGYRADTAGGVVGIDWVLDEHLLIGALLGYSKTDLDYAGGQGDATADQIRIGPYAAVTFDPWYINLSVNVGIHDNEVNRVVSFGGFDETPHAEYDAWDLNIYTEVGCDLDYGPVTLTPLGAVEYVYYHHDAYQETGGGAANLNVDAASVDSFRSLLGVRAITVHQLGDITLVPELSMGWRHEFGNDQNLTARFVGQTSGFTVTTVGDDADSFAFGAGLSALLNDQVCLTLHYDQEISADRDAYALIAGIGIRF